MPEAEQVREMVARVFEGGRRARKPTTRSAADHGAGGPRRRRGRGYSRHRGTQEQAVQIARAAGQERDALVRLSVMLYNLAGYYSNADRHADAVNVLQEVVGLDRTDRASGSGV